MTENNDFKIFTLTYSGKYTGTDEEVVIPEGVTVIPSRSGGNQKEQGDRIFSSGFKRAVCDSIDRQPIWA